MTQAPIDLRCSAQMQAAGADPVGTAGSYNGYLLVGWPRPWPQDLSEVAELEGVRTALTSHGPGVRLQGLVPEPPDRARVTLYRRPAGPFLRYNRMTLEAPAASGTKELGEQLADAAVALLTAPTAPTAPTVPSDTTDRGNRFDDRDVLVCTHGRRDRCCGSYGTELWQDLVGEADHLGAGINVWRTSHTGGHRYAATMVVLPEGTAWGFLDPGTARHVLRRDVPVGEVLHAYRGCAGLPSPAVQALERSVLATVGWSLLDTPRLGEDLGAGRVALVVDPDGEAERWEATVTPGRVLPVPECGALPVPGAKVATELNVQELARLT